MVTVAHVSALWSVEIAVNAGVDVLTHLPLEAPLERDLVERILAAGCAVNPTLAILQMATDPARGRLLAADERIARRLPAAALAAITEGREGLACPHPSPDQDVAKAIQSVARLHRAGVPILAGTDANNAPGRACPIVHGASLHAELALLVAAGLTPAEALAAATSVPARRFGLADRGRIAPGLRADLLLVDGDPTAEITATRSVAGVWRQGVRCDPADVLSADALLAHEGSHR
jgi:imidazolonepropionase-like amidohydrolase